MDASLERLTRALADRYAIEREIGGGGMATVYLAEDIRHERRVALKVLRSDLAASLGAERFLQEVRVTANLQHPHILPLFDSGEADGFLFFVMPYIEGESLRERLVREHELPVPEVARLLRDVVDALAAAHRLGVVHRDIKPENVLLSGRHAMVADFGVAKAVSEATGRHKLTTLGVALGTPSYMAPEQAAADEAIDHRADIYAVGVMAYELLAGRPPFAGSTPQQVLAAQVMDAPQPVTELRASVPPALAALVMRCLEKKPADRWQSAEEMLPHLEAAATPSRGITPTGTQPFTATLTGKRRSPWAAGVLTVGVIAVGVWVVRSTLGPGVDDRPAVPVVPKQLTANPLELSLTGSAISPDGDYLAFVDPRGVHIQTLATHETHAIPLEAALTPWRVWWYPDGTHLLLQGTDSDDRQSLWSVSMFGGVPRQVLTGVWQAAVAPDGATIATIRSEGTVGQTFREIWIMGPNGENAQLLATADPDESFWRIAWTPDGTSLAVGTWSNRGNTRDIHISLISVADGQRRVLFSDPDLWQGWTGPLPVNWCGDSRLVFSRRDGPAHQVTSNLWMADVDLRAAELIGEPRRLTQWTGANVRELSVTRDCSRVVVLQVRNQADVFVGDLDTSGNAFSAIEKITFDEREDYPGGWAPDGSGLLISSARSGDYDVYYRDLEADALTRLQGGQGDQRHPIFAPGGERVLYVQDGDIWAVPLSRGAAQLIQAGEFGRIHCPAAPGAPCVAGSVQDGRYVFHLFDPDNHALREVATTEHREPFTNFDLSPDGTRVAVVHNDDDKILIVDLETGAETAIAVEGWSKFEYISWTAEGDGFFVNAGFGARAQHLAALVRVGLDGRSHVLRYVPSEWQVRPRASPDGRHVAYASMPFHGNAWLIEGF